MNPNPSTQGIDFSLHEEFGSRSAQAHSRGASLSTERSSWSLRTGFPTSTTRVFPQRRPARDRCRTASTADVGGPAPNFSTTRPNLAEATKLLTSEEKTCAIAGNGVDFKIMAGRCMLRRDVMIADLRKGSTRTRASCGCREQTTRIPAELEKRDSREVSRATRAAKEQGAEAVEIRPDGIVAAIISVAQRGETKPEPEALKGISSYEKVQQGVAG
ncbi:hypothetical protein SAMN05443247_11486 [Bradyrhizobium erythrophlei]|jgi:hypothetical protein|nr:hypothetical protein SAMN05443247_11486 [Bradyrhizobium erythrophlei]